MRTLSPCDVSWHTASITRIANGTYHCGAWDSGTGVEGGGDSDEHEGPMATYPEKEAVISLRPVACIGCGSQLKPLQRALRNSNLPF